MLKKLFTLTVAASLALSSFPVSGFAFASSHVFSSESVNAFASVTEASFKNSAVSVFNIQDLHFNTETQKKIFGLLEKLNASYPKLELYIEGASENSDFEWVYSSLGKKSGAVFLEALFDSGNLSGAEYFAAKYGKKINSVEDKQVFDRNLLLFAELIEQRSEIEHLIRPLESALSELRNKYFSSEQKRMFSAYTKYRDGFIEDSDYFDFLRKESFKNGIDINDYPNIALYMLTSGSVMSVSQKKLQAQMSSLFSNLKNILSYKQYSELLAMSNNLKDRQALVSYLYSNMETVNLKHYPELNKFIISIALSDKMNRLEFINEENNLFGELSAKLSDGENSGNIMFMSRFIDIYKDVLMASATADEYRYFRENISKFKNLVSQYISAESYEALGFAEANAVDFNDTNLRRNEIFISRVLDDEVQPSGIYPQSHFGVESNARAVFESATKSKVKVIVAGGFHTDGINDILNKKQVSNITFMPKISSQTKDFSGKYVEYVRMLHSAGNAAIPLPVYNELTMSELSSRVLDALSKEHINKGFDLSSENVKSGVERFLSARHDMEEIEFSYDRESNEMLIRYKEKGSDVMHSVHLNVSGYLSGTSASNLTMLGDVVPAMVKNMLKGATFRSTNTIPNIFLRMVKDTSYYFERYNGSDIDRLKDDISTGIFDYDGFFTELPSMLNAFIVKTLASLKNINAEYPNIYQELKNRAEILLNYDDINIRIVDSSFLINEEGWCLAALSESNDGKTATLYVHSEFVEALRDKSTSERENILQDLIMHEVMENNAIFNQESGEYLYFGQYLYDNGIGEEGRTTIGFHDFIRSPQFRRMLREEEMVSVNQKGQENLLRLGNSVRVEISSRHEKIQGVRSIDSFDDMDSQARHDLIMLRLGDDGVIEKYADEVAQYIRKNILNDEASFVIATRFTQPAHVTQKIAALVKEKTGLEIIDITQDEYIDYVSMEGLTSRENIAGKFAIAARSVGNVADKNVIVIEDITKTGFIFDEISKPLNKAGASKIIPLAILNVIDALAPRKIKGVQANKSINELFNVNDYLARYIKENPEEIAEKIIAMEGNTTKYFYYAMSSLMKENHKAFEIIVKRLNEQDALNAKRNLLKNMSEMQVRYPNTASNITPLIFFISNNTFPAEFQKTDSPLTEYLEPYRDNQMGGVKGVLEITNDELKKWGEFKWLIPLYCKLHGFTKVKIVLDGPAKVRTTQDTLMLRTAEQLTVSILYQYSSEQIGEIGDKKLKEKITKAVEDKKLAEAVAAARDSFEKNILANVQKNGLYDDRDANTGYKKAVKKIMIEVNEIVRGILAQDTYSFSPDSYSIVVGGSLVNGSATPGSDIYYDIIARDKDTAEIIQDKFLAAYQYALRLTGIVPFVANGMKIDYPGSVESSLTTLLDATIYDERSIATFFDFESVYESGDPNSMAFENYQRHVFNVLMSENPNKETLEKRNHILRIMRESISEISKPYYGIIENGSYYLPDKDSKSAERTFFGNLFASAYSNSTNKAYDYRWVLRGMEVALKEILLRNTDKIESLDSIPRDKKELVMYMFERGMFDKKVTKTQAEDLQKHIRALSKYRQENIARGKEYQWTDMSAADKPAIEAIHSFIRIVASARPVNLSKSEIAKNEIVSFVVERYSQRQYAKVSNKINRYEQWAGKNASIEMATALLLSEFTREELYDPDGILDQLGLQKTDIKDNLDMLFSVRNFPSVDKIRGDFGIQNYMDAILMRAGRVDRVYAIFADKVTDYLSPKHFEKFFTSRKTEDFLDYGKLADYYMRKGRNTLNEALKNMPFAELNSLLSEEYLNKSYSEITESFMRTGSFLDVLDKSQVARSLKDGALKELSTNGSLKNLIENEEISGLLTKSGAEFINREIRLSSNLEKLAIYLIYIPLARRINDIDLFEDIRNFLFKETQPELYLQMRRILEEHVRTQLHYAQYETMLSDLEKKVSSVLKESGINKPEVHTRVKSIYSIFEKIVSSRRNAEEETGKSVKKETREEKEKKIKDRIKEKIKDIYGFHIVVDSDEMEATMTAVEKAFAQSRFNENADLYTLKKREGGNEIERKFDYDIDRGFARVKYTYEINGLAVGEIIIYSREEYENEHNGLITRADPEIDGASDGSVKKAKSSFILTFPLAHWIYKMGENIKTGLKYADSIFKMRLSYNQLFYTDEEAFAEIKEIVGSPEFYFYSDDIIMDDNQEDTLRKILQRKQSGSRAYFVTMPDGNSYPMMFESGGYNYYEILASAGLNAEKGYVLTAEDGRELDPKGTMPIFVKLKEVEGENPFDKDFDSPFNSLRANILAALRGRPLGAVTPGEYFSKFTPEELKSVEIYANSLGLKSIEELYYAESIATGIPEGMERSKLNIRKYEYINKEELEAFVNKRKDTVFEVRTTLSLENGGKEISKNDLLEVLERFGQSVYSRGDSDKGEAVYKIIYSGNSDKVQSIIDAFEEKGFTAVTFEDADEKEVYYQRRKVYMNVVQSLGRNINALIGEIQTGLAGSAFLASNALIAMFNDSRVNKALDDLFYDENSLIMKTEAAELLASLREILVSADAKYKDYFFDLQISGNENLIKDADTYAFASLSEESLRITLHINEVFLRALENFDDEERSFYLKQLAMHEGTERVALLKGEVSSYEEFHDHLYQSNPDQAKLMEFVAKIAQDETVKRDKKQMADNIASKLMSSDALNAEKPADFILLCGNDEIATFEKTIELYDSGAIKEMIVVSGGVGRLTIPLIEKAVGLGIPITLSDGRVLTGLQEVEELKKLSHGDLTGLITLKEADIIESILLRIAADRRNEPGKVYRDIKIVKEDESTNTRENFDNETVKNIIENIKSSNGGSTVRFAYIQTPMQQMRTQATFNSVFKDKISSGEVEGVGVTVSDFYKDMESEDIVRQSAKELIRIIVYSLKGDTIPAINENGFIFEGVLGAETFIQITSLLENSRFKKTIRKEMLDLINNTKDSAGKILFPDKKSIISSLAEKVPQDSYQFEAMKMFLDFIYYDAENGIRYKGIAEQALRDGRFLSKTPLILQKAAVKAGYVPEYLNQSDRVFVFDMENADSNAELIAYMGSFGSKAFSVSQKRYLDQDDVLFSLNINTGVRDISVKAGLKKVETERGVFYDLQYSVPFIYEMPASVIDEEAKNMILSAVFENKEITEKLKAEGLDLSKSKDRLFIESLPQDKTLTTVDAVSQRIAESAGIAGEVRKVESRTEKKGLYNEKLPVAAMLRNSGDTGIGEITSVQSYADTVLKPAGVSGFTMYDLSDAEIPFAANYLLLDWMSVPEAQGVLTRDELAADVSERETVDREQVARRKIIAAAKVYGKLSSDRRAEVDMYRAANASWLDSFAARERTRYNIDIDQETFARIMALQQMLFENQLRQTVLKMADMDISMHIKGLYTNNAESVISKWIESGITSFVIDIDFVDEDVLDAAAYAASKAGVFINVAVKSQNMDVQAAHTISDFGYTPVIPYQDLGSYTGVSGFKTEINDSTFIKTGLSLQDLLKQSAQSKAESVTYPIGLLWGEVVSESAIEDYRVPAKGSKRFGGFNFGLFKVGQKTFEESYAGSYINSVEIGLNMNIGDLVFNINSSGAVEINGKTFPVAYAAAFVGNLAKKNKLSEIKNFERVIISLINELGTKENLKAARQHLDNLLSEYNSSEGEQKDINAAKIAGFIQGLSENIIINGREGQFSSKSMGRVYAGLMAEASLFKAGYYPSVYDRALPVESLLEKIEDVLGKKTLAGAISEIEPMLLNLSVPMQKNGFTFYSFALGEMAQNKEKAEKAAQIYTALTDYMIDIFIDKAATREQIKKSVRVSSIEAVRSIMSAA